MKRDEVRAIFPDASDDQVDRILNAFGGELNPLKGSLADAQRARDELTAKVGELTAQVQKGMSAEELLRQREEQAARREREFARKSNALDAREILAKSGLGSDAVDTLLEQVVTDDAESTRARAEALANAMAARTAAVEQATRDAMLKANPGLQGAGGPSAVTREAFERMGYMEQLKAVQDNPGLLKSFQ